MLMAPETIDWRHDETACDFLSHLWQQHITMEEIALLVFSATPLIRNTCKIIYYELTLWPIWLQYH